MLPVLEGSEVVEAETEGGSYEPRPWRIVLHSTEGSSIEGAIAAYRGHHAWPHMTADFRTDRVVEHYDFTQTSARALANDVGGVETNRAKAIQIELVGFAGKPWEFDLNWIARRIIVPISGFVPVKFECPEFMGPADGTLATETGKARMSYDTWLWFNGVCGHQHVPENEHWDPGDINGTELMNICKLVSLDPEPEPIPRKKVGMLILHLNLKGEADDELWLIGSRRPVQLKNEKDFWELAGKGVPVAQVSRALFKELTEPYE